MKVWTTLTPEQIRECAAEVGVQIHSDYSGSGITKDGRAWNFRLGLLSGVKRGKDHKYQRLSVAAWRLRERRVAAVCWHGHRDFMRAVFRRDPDARFKTAIADYRGSEDFENTFGSTGYNNVGSQMYPTFAKDACTCGHDEWDVDSSVGGSYAVSMPQSMIGGCPFVIFDPQHYRADGSCKCDDAAEREKMKREWEYTDADFANIPLREYA